VLVKRPSLSDEPSRTHHPSSSPLTPFQIPSQPFLIFLHSPLQFPSLPYLPSFPPILSLVVLPKHRERDLLAREGLKVAKPRGGLAQKDLVQEMKSEEIGRRG